MDCSDFETKTMCEISVTECDCLPRQTHAVEEARERAIVAVLLTVQMHGFRPCIGQETTATIAMRRGNDVIQVRG